MEELFRFMMMRPPQTPDADSAISLVGESALQDALTNAATAEWPHKAIREAIESYTSSDEFVDTVAKLQYGEQLSTLIDQLNPAEEPDLPTVRGLVQEQFGNDLAELTSSPSWPTDLKRLRDSILAITWSPQDQNKPLARLTEALRIMQLIERLAANEPELQERRTIRNALRASLIMPEINISAEKRRQPSIEISESEEEQQRSAKLEAAQEREIQLRETIEELMLIPAEKMQVSEEALPTEGSDITETIQPWSTSRSSLVSGYDGLLQNIGRFLGLSPRPAATVPFTASFAGSSKIVLKPDVINALSQVTKSLLQDLQLNVAQQSVPMIVDRLRHELNKVNDEIVSLMPNELGSKVVLIGSTAFEVKRYEDDAFMKRVQVDWDVLSEMAFVDPPIFSFNRLEPAGVADLLVVKQQLVRYASGDVAHVENILQSESKERIHRRRRTTEEFFLEELETQREEERDSQSTERFEMSRETSETLREEAKLEAGINVSAKYGAVVQVEVNADLKYSNTQARETSQKQATEFSKEIVDKSVTKYAEKIREQRTLKLVEEVEETNTHGFDNTQGDGHVVGIYQWLDKIYEAQIFNYGLRTMYDLMIPEPAAFLLAALDSNPAEEAGLVKPKPFTLEPSGITEENYGEYVAKYHAGNVNPPPELYKYVSYSHSGGPATELSQANFTTSADLTIPNGYQAISAQVTVTGQHFYGTKPACDVAIGGGQWQRIPFDYIDTSGGPSNLKVYSLCVAFFDNITANEGSGSIPITVVSSNSSVFAVAISVCCKRTNDKLNKWKLDTHAAIQTAYEQRLAEYEEKLSELLTQAGVTIQGRNPAYNQRLIADELKKAAITIITQQHYDTFGAIERNVVSVPVGNTGRVVKIPLMPQVDLEKAEKQGSYIRFFEQAFEWENMTYVFYPYFWGRKSMWLERINYDDPDPLFINFIKAGAARVVVPARPGFEKAINLFMKFGVIWEGGELPDIGDSTYLPIVEEIKNQLGSPMNEQPYGEPWMVRVPTSLVRLRPDNSLPVWVKTEEGEWLPQETVNPTG